MTTYVNSIVTGSISIGVAATTGTQSLGAPTGTWILIYDGETTNVTVTESEAWACLTISGNTVTATRGLGTAGTVVIKFIAIDATSSLVNTFQSGTLSLTSGTSTGTASISAVTTANAVLQFLGQRDDHISFLGGNFLSLSYSGTTVTGTAQSTVSGAVVCAFCVINYTGAALNSAVQSVQKSWTNSGTSTTATITSVTVNNTVLHYGGQRIIGGRDISYAQLTSATVITINCGAALSTGLTFACYVAEFIAGVWASAVQRGTITMASVTSNTATVTATGVNSMPNFLGMAQTSGATQNWDIIKTAITYSSPTVTASRNTGTGTMVGAYEVWDFAGVAAPVIGSGLHGLDGGYVSNYEGVPTIDPGMHKIDDGITLYHDNDNEIEMRMAA